MAALAVTAPPGPFWHGQISGVAAAAQGEVTGVSWADRAVFVISGLTSETVSVTGNLMGSSVYTGKLRPIDLTTGAAQASSSDLGNGSYELKDLALDSLKFTKSSTSETPTITVVLKGTRSY